MCSRSNIRCHGDGCVLYQSAVASVQTDLGAHYQKRSELLPPKGIRGFVPFTNVMNCTEEDVGSCPDFPHPKAEDMRQSTKKEGDIYAKRG